MYEGSFGEHEIELVIEPGPRLHDRGGVWETADGTRDFGQIAAGNHRRRLIVDSYLFKIILFFGNYCTVTMNVKHWSIFFLGRRKSYLECSIKQKIIQI